MAHRAHSGYVVVCCSDWAYTRDIELDPAHAPHEPVQGRVQDLVRFARNHPANHNTIDPHIVRVEGPVEVIAQPSRTGALLMLNPNVLGTNAWCIVADVHSDCAGFSGAHPQHEGDQFEAQALLIENSAQRFIDNVAAQIGHPMRLYVTWTRFGEHKSIAEVKNLADVTSRVIFEDDSWRAKAPAGLFDDAMAFSA
jgi:hypothetical protein